jgi:hypothetical protein
MHLLSTLMHSQAVTGHQKRTAFGTLRWRSGAGYRGR